MNINTMIEKRNKLWEDMKGFLDSHRQENGTLSAEDDAAYGRMEDELNSMGREVKRMERQKEIEAEMAKPVNNPILAKPGTPAQEPEEKTGTASKAYKTAFWAAIRARKGAPIIYNDLQVGTDSEGGYLVPDEFEHTLVQALLDENVFRGLAHVITTSSGDRKIPVVSSHGSAVWLEEEELFPSSDEVFGQVNIGAFKVGTLIKVSDELLYDSAFDLESYIATEFGRRLGEKEEDAFINGNGTGKPTGILNSTGGADVGVTAASSTAITADEVIDLYYSLREPYRKRAVWLMNDATVKLLRKLKDGNGQYLWQPGLREDAGDTLLGVPIKTSASMPTAAADAKTIAFGDFQNYWIADRGNRVIKRLNELFAANGQVGFMAYQRVDGKLVVPEAIKVLKMKA